MDGEQELTLSFSTIFNIQEIISNIYDVTAIKLLQYGIWNEIRSTYKYE